MGSLVLLWRLDAVAVEQAPASASGAPEPIVATPATVAAGRPARDADAARESIPEADAAVTPSRLLERMAIAMEGLEYEGTLIYHHGHQLTTLRIAHRIAEGESRESLLALSGPIRAIARSGRGVTCVLPDAHPIMVKPTPADRGLMRGTLSAATLGESYSMRALGASRIAGRTTDVLMLLPRDALRYGYRFHLDRDTGLPLKTELMDRYAEPIEQVMFTELRVIGFNADARAGVGADGRPPTMTVGAREDALGSMSEVAASSRPPVGPVAVPAFRTLPPGFRVLAREAGPHAREHILISDGLASVSVYIEPADGSGLDGATSMGAVHAVGQARDGRQVTVVGEVPAATVAAVLDALELPAGGSPP